MNTTKPEDNMGMEITEREYQTFDEDDPEYERAQAEVREECRELVQEADSAFVLTSKDGEMTLRAFGTDPQELAYSALVGSSMYAEECGLLAELMPSVFGGRESVTDDQIVI